MQIHLYQESPQDWEAFLHLCGLYYPEEAKFPLTQSGLLELCQESVKEHQQGSGRILLLFSSEEPIGFAFFQSPGNPIPLKEPMAGMGICKRFLHPPKSSKKRVWKNALCRPSNRFRKVWGVGSAFNSRSGKQRPILGKNRIEKNVSASLFSSSLGLPGISLSCNTIKRH